MKPIIIENKYQLDLRLGGGSHGEVYQAHHVDTGQEVALKFELMSESKGGEEWVVYKRLDGGHGIPRAYWLGADDDFVMLALELLGPTLEDLFCYCGRKFSLKTVLLLADQLIDRFRYFHSKGYVHRDVKPGNLLMGVGKQGNIVYVADVGLAREIRNPECTKPVVGGPPHLVGTLPYASTTAHRGEWQSPRDDMESLGYSLLYFLKGSLPWWHLAFESEEGKKATLDMKQQAEDCGLFEGVPIEFKKYFDLIHSGSKVDYSRLQRLFRGLFHRHGYQHDNVFDWTKLKFLAEQEASRARQKS